MGARSKKNPDVGTPAETLLARAEWEKKKAAGVQAQDWADAVGISKAAMSQVQSGTHGIGGSITGWAKALGFRSVLEFRVAAYRQFLAYYDLGELDKLGLGVVPRAPESQTKRARRSG